MLTLKESYALARAAHVERNGDAARDVRYFGSDVNGDVYVLLYKVGAHPRPAASSEPGFAEVRYDGTVLLTD